MFRLEIYWLEPEAKTTTKNGKQKKCLYRRHQIISDDGDSSCAQNVNRLLHMWRASDTQMDFNFSFCSLRNQKFVKMKTNIFEKNAKNNVDDDDTSHHSNLSYFWRSSRMECDRINYAHTIRLYLQLTTSCALALICPTPLCASQM